MKESPPYLAIRVSTCSLEVHECNATISFNFRRLKLELCKLEDGTMVAEFFQNKKEEEQHENEEEKSDKEALLL